MSLTNHVLTSAAFSNGTRDGTSTGVPRNSLLDAVNTIVACLAVLGNGMVITVMLLRRREFRSFTNRLILHQSIIDCITGVVFFIHKIARSPGIVVSMEDTLFDQLVCRFTGPEPLLWCMNLVSTSNLVIISLERFMATCYPVIHRNTWSKAKFKFAAGSAWAIGLAVSLQMFFFFKASNGKCQPTDLAPVPRFISNVSLIGSLYVVPMITLIYTYTRILIVITKKAENPVNSQQNTMRKAKKNVLITTLLIGIMSAVCWTPMVVLFIYSKALNVPAAYSPWYIPCTALVACNMFVNPIIYCFKYERFRSQLKDLVLGRRRRNQVQQGETVSSINRTGLTQMHTN